MVFEIPKMATKKEEQPLAQQLQGEPAPHPQSPSAPADGQPQPNAANSPIIKSGALFISSKGIGWTSWKKRWFILTRTSLVFFRSDPNAAPQRGGELNLTLGGIDLNNSGSVVVKQDKKLLTVLFPDGRDGRAFTLKAETLEDLNDWKTALENALSQAPNAGNVMGQNGILNNEQADQADGTKGAQIVNDKQQPHRCLVLRRPILLALEDVDGSPTFLEKALQFVEGHGAKVEGILRQAADVEHVERRIHEYEQGKCDFSPEEDAHVIADCVKYVIRELPSSPVPASCCNALLTASRSDRHNRLNAMRTAILDSFPEPNRRLLQRILIMMQAIASHKNVNRMSSSAVAACMAPLLLRPLLSGECEIESDFDVGGDTSLQLLQAAAAANHAQAICITLLEQYEYIFGGHYVAPDLDSEGSEFDSEDETDDESYEDDEEYEDDDGSDVYTDDENENDSAGTGSESGNSKHDGDKASGHPALSAKDTKTEDDLKVNDKLEPKPNTTPSAKTDDSKRSNNTTDQVDHTSAAKQINNEAAQAPKSVQIDRSLEDNSGGNNKGSGFWRRSSARKNVSMESLDFPEGEDLFEIEKLEATKSDLENKIAEEVKASADLQSNLERKKNSLHHLRLALEKDVARLQELLQEERKKRAALEAGLNASHPVSIPELLDDKTKEGLKEVANAEADVTHLNKKVEDLSSQLSQEREQNAAFYVSSNRNLKAPSRQESARRQKKKQKDEEKPPAKDTHLDEAVSETEKKEEQVQNQRPGLTRRNSSKPVSNAKKSAMRGEGVADSTASALTKLTSRLTFSKDKRVPIIGEPQLVRNHEKGEDLVQISEKLRKSDSHIIDGVKRSDPLSLDRGRSEGHTSLMSQNADDARGLDQPVDPKRTRGR